jgi:rhodanese-related sulfurtransferase
MLKSKFWILSILFAFLFVTSCKDDDDDPQPTPINESEVLATYLASADSPLGKDYVNSDMPSIMPATDVYTLNLTGQVYIIDIRSAADFDAGHIENAVNVAAGDVLNHLDGMDLSAYEKVAIVCYTGQTAGWVTSILRIMGYDKAYSMKWGMCSWHTDFASKWNDNIGNTYWSQFTTTATDKGAMGSMPKLNTGKTSGMDILNARVNTVLAEGFAAAKISSATVFGALDNYYIVNYWKLDHYDVGHIPGAIQYTPKADIALGTYLKTLPTDKTIVVYCYTGQTSAFMAAYLRLLGYDAVSLLFGANGMMYDEMVNQGMTVFNAAQINDYPTVQ